MKLGAPGIFGRSGCWGYRPRIGYCGRDKLRSGWNGGATGCWDVDVVVAGTTAVFRQLGRLCQTVSMKLSGTYV